MITDRRKALFAFVLLLVMVVPVEFSWAERPFLATERAIPLERGRYRLDNGIAIEHFSSQKNQTSLTSGLRYGHSQNLELGLFTSYLFGEENSDHKNHIGDIFLKSKIRFLKGRESNPLSISGQLFIKLPTAGFDATFNTSGEPDVGVLAIASKEFIPLTAHINLGYTLIGNSPRDQKIRGDMLSYALGMDFTTREEFLTLVLEAFGRKETGNAATNGLWSVAGGAIYQAEKDTAFDISTGVGLNHNQPDYSINFGMIYLFQ